MTTVWDGGAYAGNTAHHRAYDHVVLGGLDLSRDGHVLDVGCGAGDLTRELLDAAPLAHVRGVDADPSMVQTAAAGPSHPRLSFVQAPVQHLDRVVPGGWADHVVTVATLHWVPREEQPVALAQLCAVLRPGGTLRIDMGGAGQIAETRAILGAEAVRLGGGRTPWCFPEVSDYQGLLTAAGFDADTLEVRLIHQERSMPDVPAVAGWLDSQVLIAYRAGLPADAWPEFVNACHARVSAEGQRADGSYDQHYVRMFVTAHKPS